MEPELTVIDTLGSALKGDLSSEDTVRPAMDYLDSVRHRYHSAIWFNHHQRKGTADNKKPNKLSDLYGSMYISARASSVYCLYPENSSQSELSLICLKNRFGKIPDPAPLVRTDTLKFNRPGEGTEALADRVGHGDDKPGSSVGESEANGSGPDF